MRKITLCLIAFSLLLFCTTAYADKIYLKNGKVYDGKLLGKSDKRFLFSVDVDGVTFNMSFFPEEVEKLELEKKTVEEQIPYLKDVGAFKVETPKTYEISLYGAPNKEQEPQTENSVFSEEQLNDILSKDESEYYNNFTYILKKYVDKLNFILGIYSDTASATRDDFLKAKQYLDEMIHEFMAIKAPDIFKKAHADYVESLRSSSLGFTALGHGMLDQAQAQIKLSEDLRQKALLEFRNIIMKKRNMAEVKASEEDTDKGSE